MSTDVSGLQELSCYCVCHNPLSSCFFCGHCNGINVVSDGALHQQIYELEHALKEVETAYVKKLHEAMNKVDEMNTLFERHWAINIMAIKYWQSKTGKETEWPDLTSHMKWLMDRVIELEKQHA